MTDYLVWTQDLDFESGGPFPTMEVISEDGSRQRHLAQVPFDTYHEIHLAEQEDKLTPVDLFFVGPCDDSATN